jgi:thymidine kinase
MLDNDLNEYDGKIWIMPSICAYPGTGHDDIDILIMGYLQDYVLDEVGYFKNISFRSFCVAIEVKSHDASSMDVRGSHLWVCYPNGEKDVTKQNQEQNQTLQKILSDNLYNEYIDVPFVSNVIWLTGINKDDFDSFFHLVDSNILCSDSTTEELFSAIARRSKLRDNGFFDAFKASSIDDIEWVAKLFCAHLQGADTMTIKRLNLIPKISDDVLSAVLKPDPVIVLSGHAGTGKTIMLLQAANYLMSRGKNCLFLTYNIALLSDLKHTIQYVSNMNAPEMKSMHQFFIALMAKNGLWDGSKDINNDFLNAVSRLNSGFISKGKITTKFDYILIDEAQDWSKTLIDALKGICQTSNTQIVIADGIDQFMQNADQPEWGMSSLPQFQICKRQCNNLTIFVKAFAAKMGVAWDVRPNGDLLGGKVIVTNDYGPDMHAKYMKECADHGGTAYDYMLLAPNSLVDKGEFALKQAYAAANINIFDASNYDIRNSVYDESNAKNNEHRLYPYESCRGLEAWTVVCLRFHELFTLPHPHDYKEINYEAGRRYMQVLWALMPLTRAVHTIIITIDANDHVVLPVLRELENELDGIVSIEIK